MTDPLVITSIAREIVVYGLAQPQGNKSAFVVRGRAIMREGRSAAANDRFHGWRDAVAQEARRWLTENGSPAPLDGPVCLSVMFYLPRPKSAPRRVLYPLVRPDVSKLARNVEDALSGLFYTDDSRIVDLRVYKRFATDSPPRAEIAVHAMTEAA